MKLGIAVVYMVSEGNGPLLDLHLERIARHTSVEYTIYAAANRLAPEFIPRLQADPNVSIRPCKPTRARSVYEHSHYLTQLVDEALADGCSHAAILHVDSFPIRDGWAEALAEKAGGENSLAGAFLRENDERIAPNTACLFVPRRFYEHYGPVRDVRQQPARDPDYRAYRQIQDPIRESGDPYGYLLFKHSLPWHKMMRSNAADDHPIIGGVYDDAVFHLGGAARPSKAFWGDFLRTGRSGAREKLDRAIYKRVPPMLGRAMPGFIRRLWQPWRREVLEENRRVFADIKRRLFDDPDAYISYLRTGVRSQ